jgi:hypothetical protein
MIRKIISLQNDRQERDVRSANTAMAAINRHDILRGSSDMTVPILARYRVIAPQLQLWHLHWLVFVQSVGGRFVSHGDVAPINTQCLPDNVDQVNIARIPVHQYWLDHLRHRRLPVCRSIRRVCILWSFDQNSALLSTLCHLPSQKCVAPLDGKIQLKN